MPIYLAKNPYKGVNAHFNSFLLHDKEDGNWQTFHHNYITKITDVLNQVLPQHYFALAEQSIQIQAQDTGRTIPDVSIFKQGESFGQPAPIAPSMEPTLTVDVTLFMQDVDLGSVVIYQLSPRRKTYPVARIEVLSPSNKAADVELYLTMRQKMLQTGVVMVEIDYLHETPSPFPYGLPDYTKGQSGAYPFYIVITNPDTHLMDYYAFHVDDAIPVLAIPLAQQAYVGFDFGAAYHQTFEHDRRAHLLIDYAELPLHFEAYQPADQARIQALMERVSQEN